MPNVSDKDKDQLETLAVKIFTSNSPSDPVVLPEVYLKCLDMGKSYKACVASGR